MKQNLQSRTFALLLIIWGLLALSAGLICGLARGTEPTLVLIMNGAALIIVVVGAVALRQRIARDHPHHKGDA